MDYLRLEGACGTSAALGGVRGFHAIQRRFNMLRIYAHHNDKTLTLTMIRMVTGVMIMHSTHSNELARHDCEHTRPY